MCFILESNNLASGNILQINCNNFFKLMFEVFSSEGREILYEITRF